jgi:glycosyltransferase involved in cell wall biosynthesis
LQDMRRVLLIAYHFPPIRGSSGVQRTLRFAQHLPRYGWQPVVLTIHPRAYPEAGNTEGNEVPEGIEVHRAFGLDTARHLRLAGRYPGPLAVPDRWMSWAFWAIPKALSLIRSRQIDAVWSTFPIATAHTIALKVVQRSGLPWIAEFRDPMWQGSYPYEPAVNRAFKELEEAVCATADRVVLTTPSAVDQYRRRFPRLPPERIALIENGFDEETFARAECGLQAPMGPAAAGQPRPLTLLHSGLIYPRERDPLPFFRALATLKSSGVLGAADVRVVLRASGHEGEFRRAVAELGIDDIVRLEPPVDYLAALEEMLTVDALLLMQAANCNAQIPAKLYEYLRAGRPILALTDPQGDTGRTLRAAGSAAIARLDSEAEIRELLPKFLSELRAGAIRGTDSEVAAHYSRGSQTAVLAQWLDALVQGSN